MSAGSVYTHVTEIKIIIIIIIIVLPFFSSLVLQNVMNVFATVASYEY